MLEGFWKIITIESRFIKHFSSLTKRALQKLYQINEMIQITFFG